MSRSRKKSHVSKDHPSKNMKRFANKRVRQLLKRKPEEVLNYKQYRKVFQSYDLCDYIFFYPSFEDFIKQAYSDEFTYHRPHSSIEELKKYWNKRYVRK